jgi:hypothetical protein
LVHLLRTASDPDGAAVGEWSVADLAVHLTDIFENYPRYLRGEGPLFSDPLDITAHNAERVAAGKGRAVSEAAERIAIAAAELDAMLEHENPHRSVTWHGGAQLDLGAFLSIVGSEALVHGYDLALAQGRSAKPTAADASVILANLTALLPHYLNREAAAGFDAVYDLRTRAGDRRIMIFRDGLLQVTTRPRRADCIIWTDAYTFLLVGYGRVGQVKAALTGKMMAWGRKPWLALKLPDLISSV